jgi:hypothetical protein
VNTTGNGTAQHTTQEVQTLIQQAKNSSGAGQQGSNSQWGQGSNTQGQGSNSQGQGQGQGGNVQNTTVKNFKKLPGAHNAGGGAKRPNRLLLALLNAFNNATKNQTLVNSTQTNATQTNATQTNQTTVTQPVNTQMQQASQESSSEQLSLEGPAFPESSIEQENTTTSSAPSSLENDTSLPLSSLESSIEQENVTTSESSVEQENVTDLSAPSSITTVTQNTTVVNSTLNNTGLSNNSTDLSNNNGENSLENSTGLSSTEEASLEQQRFLEIHEQQSSTEQALVPPVFGMGSFEASIKALVIIEENGDSYEESLEANITEQNQTEVLHEQKSGNLPQDHYNYDQGSHQNGHWIPVLPGRSNPSQGGGSRPVYITHQQFQQPPVVPISFTQPHPVPVRPQPQPQPVRPQPYAYSSQHRRLLSVKDILGHGPLHCDKVTCPVGFICEDLENNCESAECYTYRCRLDVDVDFKK